MVSRERGDYACVYDEKTGRDEFMFMPKGGYDVTVMRPLSESCRAELRASNQRATPQFIREQLSRLALHKHVRVGPSTAQAFFADLTSDIEGAGELAVMEACARLRRAESQFYPSSHEIIRAVQQVTDEITAVLAAGQENGSNGDSGR